MPDRNPGQAQPQARADARAPRPDTGVLPAGPMVIALAGAGLIHVGLRARLASVNSAIRLFAAVEVERPGGALMGGRAAVTGLCERLSPPPWALKLDPGPQGRLLRRRRMP